MYRYLKKSKREKTQKTLTKKKQNKTKKQQQQKKQKTKQNKYRLSFFKRCFMPVFVTFSFVQVHKQGHLRFKKKTIIDE